MELIEPLEQLIRSDVDLSILGREIKNLIVTIGPIGGHGKDVIHIGPDTGILDVSYNRGSEIDGGPTLNELMVFEESRGYLLAFTKGGFYLIHNKRETLKIDDRYMHEVSKEDYLKRCVELQGK